MLLLCWIGRLRDGLKMSPVATSHRAVVHFHHIGSWLLRLADDFGRSLPTFVPVELHPDILTWAQLGERTS